MINYTHSPLVANLREKVDGPSADERRYICRALIDALDQFYVHLPQKKAGFAIDPVQRLLVLQNSDGRGFTRSLLRTINGLHDRHTTLKLARPWSSLVAYVPLVLERFYENGRAKYVMTKSLFGYDELPVGTEVTHWNGQRVERLVREHALQSQGANWGASMQLAVANLSIRPLAFHLMPVEDWVTLSYIAPDGSAKATSTPWRFFSNQVPPPMQTTAAGAAHTDVGLDEMTLISNQVKQENRTPTRALQASPFTSEMNGQLEYGPLEHGERSVAYVRLRTFEVPDATQFVTRMAEILQGLPQDGLILDIRSNPGGLIPAGQKLIRLLTDGPVTPSPVAFRNTEATRLFGQMDQFAPWKRSLDVQQSTGQLFTQAFPLTSYEDVPDYRYPGKVVLIIDGLCYSTSDFFAADFKDNQVGRIIGVDAATGGGGANVWSLNLLNRFMGRSQWGDLPSGYDLNISMRRSLRTGESAGIPVEDLGVEADLFHAITRRDVLNFNADLLALAANSLH